MLDTLTSWTQRYCAFPTVQADLLNQAYDAEVQQRNFRIVLGAQLSSTGAAYLVHSQDRELFIFELTPPQTQLTDAFGSTLEFILGGPAQPAEGELPLELNQLTLRHRNGIGPAVPIRGRCVYRAVGEVPEPPCLQLCLLLRGGNEGGGIRTVTSFHYPPRLLGSGTLDFQFVSLESAAPDEEDWLKDKQWAVACARFCTPLDPNLGKQAIPLSRAVGTLVLVDPTYTFEGGSRWGR